MVLTIVPQFPREKISALLDLIGKAEISDIELKVHMIGDYVGKRPLTPSISIIAEAGYVEGLTSVAEIRALLLNNNYQLLKMEVELKTGEEIRVDFLRHTLEQRVRSEKRFLSMDILKAKGLIGPDAIEKFTEVY